MSLYVDTSALLKRYVKEADTAEAVALLGADPLLVTARHTEVELRRNLARLVEPGQLAAVRARALADLAAMAVVALDDVTCQAAAEIGEQTGARTLDALHLAAARRAGVDALCTFDGRQAQAARALGLHVVGV